MNNNRYLSNINEYELIDRYSAFLSCKIYSRPNEKQQKELFTGDHNEI